MDSNVALVVLVQDRHDGGLGLAGRLCHLVVHVAAGLAQLGVVVVLSLV